MSYGDRLIVSLAGAVGSWSERRKANLQEALRRLAYSDSERVSDVSSEDVVFGVVNGSQIWVESPHSAGLLGVFDGELYEREELCRVLSVPASVSRCNASAGAVASDPEIIGAAYRRWGDEFPDYIDGEFAFAIWDAGRRRLILGKDAMGRRALHYSTVGNLFVFASEPRGLRGWPGLDCGIDEEQIARLLSRQTDAGRTLFRGIRYLPGGCVLVVEQDRPPRLVRYWRPHESPQLRSRDSREYEEALKLALKRAVKLRLPPEGLVGSHLSAGLDSSGVTALAAQELKDQGRKLVAYTSVPAHDANAEDIMQNRYANEWPIAHKVAEMYSNIEHVPVMTDGADWWEALDTMSDVWEAPPGFIRNVLWFYGLHKDAQERGISVMLEAHAGNLTSSYDGAFGLYDLRLRGRWLELGRAVRLRRKMGQRWPSIINGVWMPSPKMRARMKRALGNKPKSFYELSLMNPQFYGSTGLPAVDFSPVGGAIEGDRSSGAAWRLSLLSIGDFGMEVAGMKRYFGLKLSDPTEDRGLVELCMRIPDEAFCPQGVKRDLYRRAFHADLPPELLNEKARGLQASDFLTIFGKSLRLFRSEVDRLTETSSIGKYLDLNRMKQMLEAWPQESSGPRGEIDLAYNYTFGGALAMGRFLRRWQGKLN